MSLTKMRQAASAWLFGATEHVSYRLTHVFTYRRPYPLLKLLLDYSGNDEWIAPVDVDKYFVYRDQLDHELTMQLQNLAILECCYKYNEKPPEMIDNENVEFPDFRLEVRQSQIRGAGKGVYVHGKVKRGQVVCMYPGMSYFQVRQGTIDQYGLNLRFPRGARDHILTLERQIWIDGNPRLSVVSNAMKNQIWARGHLINHPTLPSTSPNVVPVLYDFGPDFVQYSNKLFRSMIAEKRINLEKFVCAEFAWEFARAESEYIPNGVFVALRDIEDGEELFYDYEWEWNINFIEFAMKGDITFDWPWYQSVPQREINGLIEPFMTRREFDRQTETDSRLNQIKKPTFIEPVVKSQPANVLEDGKQTIEARSKAKDEEEVEAMETGLKPELMEQYVSGRIIDEETGEVRAKSSTNNMDAVDYAALSPEEQKLEDIDLQGFIPMAGGRVMPATAENKKSLEEVKKNWFARYLLNRQEKKLADQRQNTIADPSHWREYNIVIKDNFYKEMYGKVDDDVTKRRDEFKQMQEAVKQQKERDMMMNAMRDSKTNATGGTGSKMGAPGTGNKIDLGKIPLSSWQSYEAGPQALKKAKDASQLLTNTEAIKKAGVGGIIGGIESIEGIGGTAGGAASAASAATAATAASAGSGSSATGMKRVGEMDMKSGKERLGKMADKLKMGLMSKQARQAHEEAVEQEMIRNKIRNEKIRKTSEKQEQYLKLQMKGGKLGKKMEQDDDNAKVAKPMQVSEKKSEKDSVDLDEIMEEYRDVTGKLDRNQDAKTVEARLNKHRGDKYKNSKPTTRATARRK